MNDSTQRGRLPGKWFEQLKRRGSQAIARLGPPEMVVLVALLFVIGGVWGFVVIADLVVEGEAQEFDEWVVQSLRRADEPDWPIGPRWLREVGRDLTALGGVAVLTLMTIAVAGYLCLAGKFAAMWLVLVATLGGLMASTFLKALFDRPRPDIVPHLAEVATASFPSGHSLMAAVVYLTLGTLLTKLVTTRRIKYYFLAWALLLTFLVGFSRLYLGVHYPTDILGGWVVGLVWAVLCWLVARWLQRRGQLETRLDP